MDIRAQSFTRPSTIGEFLLLFCKLLRDTVNRYIEPRVAIQRRGEFVDAIYSGNRETND